MQSLRLQLQAMNAQQLTVEPDAPETWRADAPALDEAWLAVEQQDAAVRAWLERVEAERGEAACLI